MKLRGLGMKNKRGDILSILIVVVVMTALLITIYLLGFVTNNIVNEVNSTELGLSATANESLSGVQERTIPLADTMGAIVFFGWFIALIVSAVYTDFSPVVIGIFILLLILGVYLSAVMSANFYEEIDTELQGDISGGNDFTISENLLGSNFPYIVLFIGLLIIIIIYRTKRTVPTGGF